MEYQGIYRQESSGSCSTRIGEDLTRHPESYARGITADDPGKLRPPVSHQALFYHSFPNSPNNSQSRLVTTSLSRTPTASEYDHSDSDADDELPIEHRTRRQRQIMSQPTTTRLQSFLRRSRRQVVRFWRALHNFMTMPLWAALASLIVACIQPLQHALNWHMQAVKGALGSAGNCSIPVTLVVLGAYFYPPPPNPYEIDEGQNVHTAKKSQSSLIDNLKSMLHMNKGREATAAKKETRSGETMTVVISVLSRMVITPLLILPMMALSTKFTLHSVFEE